MISLHFEAEKGKYPVNDESEIAQLWDDFTQADEFNTDYLGSYTGTGFDGDYPVQDADDL